MLNYGSSLWRNDCFSRNNCWVCLSSVQGKNIVSESWVSNLHKTTCFVINYPKNLARGSPVTENLPLASGHPSSLSKKLKKKLNKRNCPVRGHASISRQCTSYPRPMNSLPISPPRPSFLKAEHSAPVCTPKCKEVAKKQLFVGGWRWSLG